MKVLMITGDRRFGPGHPRYEMQAAAVEKLTVLYWGRGAIWPKIPEGHFDVVTAQDPFWRGHVAWHIAWWIGAKLNIQVHTDLDAQPMLLHIFAQINLRRADSVRVVSEKIKAQVVRMGIRVPVHVLPIYVEVDRFKTLERKPHDTKTLLWIGRFEAEKDPMLALEVITQIPGAKLVMLGAGSLEAELKRKALNLAVEFPGWQDTVPYLAMADVVLSTSRHESYGASIIEALAAGVPVVAPDVGIAREVGATIKARSDLASGVKDVLYSGVRGKLKLSLPSAQQWAKQWKKTLI